MRAMVAFVAQKQEESMNKHFLCLGIAVILIFTANIKVSNAGNVDPELMKGWEAGSEYNNHYDIREYEKIRVWFIRAKEVTPMPGMSPATVLEVREGDDIIEVHIGPVWFRKPSEIPLKKNDRIKIKGVWAEINGKDVFMASKIKKDPDFEILKVRLTKDGTPFWTMTPEQLKRETMSDEAKEEQQAKKEEPQQPKSQ